MLSTLGFLFLKLKINITELHHHVYVYNKLKPGNGATKATKNISAFVRNMAKKNGLQKIQIW